MSSISSLLCSLLDNLRRVEEPACDRLEQIGDVFVCVLHSRLLERQQSWNDQHRVLSCPMFAVSKTDANDQVKHEFELERQFDVRGDSAVGRLSDDGLLAAEVFDQRRHKLDKLCFDVLVFQNLRQTADQNLVANEQRV